MFFPKPVPKTISKHMGSRFLVGAICVPWHHGELWFIRSSNWVHSRPKQILQMININYWTLMPLADIVLNYNSKLTCVCMFYFLANYLASTVDEVTDVR